MPLVMRPRYAPVPAVSSKSSCLLRWTRILCSAASLAASVALVAQTPANDPYQWRNVVIKGGGYVTGLVYHPTARDVFYARTDVGGAFRWNAGAAQWIPITDSLGRDDSQLTGVLSVAVDPRDANRVYLACGQYTASWARQAAVLASDDQGATWTRTALALKLGGNEDGRGTGERLQVDPNDGRILFLGTNNSGLWRSQDRAATWSRITAFEPAAVTFVVFEPASGSAGSATQTIYAGVNSTSVPLLKSTDGGTTWNGISGQPTGLVPLHAKLSADGQLYVSYSDVLGPNGASRGAVWRLDTATGAWTNITPPTGQGGFSGVSLDTQRPAVVLISTLDRWAPRDELYLSRDRGATWTAVMATATLDVSSAPYAGASSPHWITDVEIDPFDSAKAWFVTGYGVFSTGNLTAIESGGSVSWVFRNDGLEETVPLALISPPSGASLVSAIGDIDGFRHDALGVSPPQGRLTPRYGTNRSIDFAELAPSTMVRTYDSGTRGSASTDGGTTWSAFAAMPSTASNGSGAVAVGADGNRLIWMPTRSIPYYSNDRGATWTPSTGTFSPGTNSFVPVSDRVNPLRFYCYDYIGGRLYGSSDGGVSFSGLASLPASTWEILSDCLRATPGQEGHLWAMSGPHGLRRSVDGGATFSAVTTVQAAYRLGFGKAAPGQSYPAIFLWGRVDAVTGVFRSDDVGATWKRINDDEHQYGWINAIIGDPRVYGRVYVATGGRGIVYGDLAPLLPASDYATFTPGTAGAYAPVSTRSASGVTYSATGLPSWAQLDAATGRVTGTPPGGATGFQQVIVRGTETSGATSEMKLNLYVTSGTADLSVVNLSARAPVGTGADILIPGISISGSGQRTFLIRAVGPTLEKFGLTGVLADPQLTVIPQGQTTVAASNDNWGQQSDMAAFEAAMTRSQAFPLDAGAKDSAVVTALSAGPYTAKVEGVSGGTGVALLEVYDVTTSASQARLANISVRAVAGSGANILVAGIVVQGGGSRRVLVRGIGPALTSLFGLPGTVSDPVLTLHRMGEGGASTELARSGAWGDNPNAAELKAAAQTVSAFGLPEGSKDAAMLPLLAEGRYTLSLASQSGSAGGALIEVYVMP